VAAQVKLVLLDLGELIMFAGGISGLGRLIGADLVPGIASSGTGAKPSDSVVDRAGVSELKSGSSSSVEAQSQINSNDDQQSWVCDFYSGGMHFSCSAGTMLGFGLVPQRDYVKAALRAYRDISFM
jgi:hypothetical protein